VLSGDLIRQRGDINLLEAETRAVGITAVPTPGNGNNAMVARGFSGVTSVMQLYDGVQLFVGSGTVTFPFEPWTVDRVEILSGPSSVLYGSGAIGGVVNVVPRQPDSMNRSAEARASAGSFNTQRVAIDTTGPINSRLSYRFDAAYNRSDGWVERGDSESLAVSAALRFDVSPDLKLMLTDDFGRQDPMRYYGDPLINGALDTRLRFTNYDITDAIEHYEDNWLQAKVEWTPFANWTLRNTAYMLNTDRHWNNEEQFAYQPATGLLLRNGYLEIYHHEVQVGDHGDASWKGEMFGLTHAIVAGFDANRVRFENVSNSPFPGASTVNPYNFDPGLFIHAAATTPVVLTHTTQYSVFFEDKIDLTSSLALVTGARNDHYALVREDARAHTQTNHQYQTTSWRAGLVQKLPIGLMGYAQYAVATDPVGSLITLSPAQQIFDLTTGRQVEIGAKQALMNGRGEWTLAYYQIVKNNILAPVPGQPTVQQQIGQQSSRGVEASLAFTLVKGLRLEANGTLLKAKFDSFGENVGGAVISRAGNRPPNIPNETANVFVTWDALGQWELRGGLRYVGARFTNNANTVFMPSYNTLDVGVKYDLTPKTSVSLRIANAFDRIYATSSTNAGAQWLLGAPRSVELTFNGRF
jgi:iron complex outermembrane receptor protein